MTMLYLDTPTPSVHDPGSWTAGHPEGPARGEAIRAAVDAAEAAELIGLSRLESLPATESELGLVHSSEHIAQVRDLCRSGGGSIAGETYVGPASYDAARQSAGAALALARALASGMAATAFSPNRPGGHHAGPWQPGGYCLFNNVALAAELAIRELGIERVMILDWDVHHGHGTTEIFRRRSDVLVVDIHQAGLVPATGELSDTGSGGGRGFTVNLPVPAGSDGTVWLSLMEHVITPIGLSFEPELILISAGFDADARDAISDCELDVNAFAGLACHARELARRVRCPIGAVLEGGYSLDALAEGVVATIAALDGDGEATSAALDELLMPEIVSELARRWEL